MKRIGLVLFGLCTLFLTGCEDVPGSKEIIDTLIEDSIEETIVVTKGDEFDLSYFDLEIEDEDGNMIIVHMTLDLGNTSKLDLGEHHGVLTGSNNGVTYTKKIIIIVTSSTLTGYSFPSVITINVEDSNIDFESLLDLPENISYSDIIFDNIDVDFGTVGQFGVSVGIRTDSSSWSLLEFTLIIEDKTPPVFEMSDINLEVGTQDIDYTKYVIYSDDNSNTSLHYFIEETVNFEEEYSGLVTVWCIDVSGNQSSKIVRLTITDTIAPQLVENYYTVEYGNGINEENFFVVEENSNSGYTTLFDFSQVDSSQMGVKTYSVIFEDQYMNSQEFIVQIEIVDTTAPILLTRDMFLEAGVTYTSWEELPFIFEDASNKTTILSDFNLYNFYDEQDSNITIEYEDIYNNIQTSEVHLVITDTMPPVVECETYFEFEIGSYFTDFDSLIDSVTDYSRISRDTFNMSRLDTSILGTQFLSYEVRDARGNEVEVILELNIIDSVLPVFDIPAEITLEATQVPFDMNVYISNVYDKSYSVNSELYPMVTTIEGEYNAGVVGIYEVSISICDSSLNCTEQYTSLNVEDNTLPSYELEKERMVNKGATPIDFLDFHIEENSSNLVLITKVSDNVDYNTFGVYEVEVNIDDQNGNSVTEVIRVTVSDYESPVLSLIGEEIVYLDFMEDYVEEGYIVTDNLDDDVEVVIIDRVAYYEPGTYVIRYIATDNHGNKTTVSRTIIISTNDYENENEYIVYEQHTEGNQYPIDSYLLGDGTLYLVIGDFSNKLIKQDFMGNTLWETSFDDYLNTMESGLSTIGFDGTHIYIYGSDMNESFHDTKGVIFKVDLTGEIIQFTLFEEIEDIEELLFENNSIYFAGKETYSDESMLGMESYRAVVGELSSELSVQWSNSYGGSVLNTFLIIENNHLVLFTSSYNYPDWSVKEYTISTLGELIDEIMYDTDKALMGLFIDGDDSIVGIFSGDGTYFSNFRDNSLKYYITLDSGVINYRDLIQVSDGTICVVGVDNESNALIVSLDEYYSVIEQRTFSGTGSDRFNTIVEVNGYLYISGYSSSWDGDFYGKNNLDFEHEYNVSGLFYVKINADFTTFIVDQEPPTIELIGESIQNIEVDTTYEEPGAISIDRNDGTVEYKILGHVNTQIPGVYEIFYYTTDSVGNTAYIQRIVNVYETLTTSNNYLYIVNQLNDNQKSLFEGYDSNNDGLLTEEELLQITELELNSDLISYEFLHFLVNLEKLTVRRGDNFHAELLENLVNIKYLDISSNYPYSDYSIISNFTDLEHLAIGGNTINDVTNLSELTFLSTNGTYLPQMDNLEYLYMHNRYRESIQFTHAYPNLRQLQISLYTGNTIEGAANIVSVESLEINNYEKVDLSFMVILTNVKTLKFTIYDGNNLDFLLSLTELEEVTIYGYNRLEDSTEFQEIISTLNENGVQVNIY